MEDREVLTSSSFWEKGNVFKDVDAILHSIFLFFLSDGQKKLKVDLSIYREG
jgi:hypothetical protein